MESALISAAQLKKRLDNNEPLLIIDLCGDENFNAGHIAGAVHIKPSQLSCGIKPAPGKLPTPDQLQILFRSIGLTHQSQVVVYDDASGSWAGRMMWTLELIGHSHAQLLDGGRFAWQKAGFAFTKEQSIIVGSHIEIQINNDNIANINEITSTLNDENTAIWDARSADEYAGLKKLAARAGHIPGAIHCEWTDLTDDEGFLLDLNTIQAQLNQQGLGSDKKIITHCQTHRRSGLTWFVAKKLLHYPSIKAYPGSWSEWGNSEDTPIEIDT